MLHRTIRQAKVFNTWDALKVPSDEPLRAWQLEAVLEESVSGLVLPEVATPEQCQRSVAQVMQHLRSKNYGGAAGNLGEALGDSHWGVRYDPGRATPEAWHIYFDRVEAWDKTRNDLLGPVFGCDPLDMIMGILQASWPHGQVRRAVHPRFGRKMGAGLLRFGVPLPHVDNAGWDVPMETFGHVGVVLVLHARPGALQRAYRTKLAAPVLEGPRRGNYDLEVPADVEAVEVPSETGSLNLLAANFVHEVDDDPTRLTLALHVVRAKNGDLLCYA